MLSDIIIFVIAMSVLVLGAHMLETHVTMAKFVAKILCVSLRKIFLVNTKLAIMLSYCSVQTMYACMWVEPNKY